MFLRLLLSGVMAASLMTLVSQASADDQIGTHMGIVVSVEGNKLTMSDKYGKNEHSHMVPASATITCDGKACRLQDLKKGMVVSVTIEKQGEKNAVTRIDAKQASPR
jgi:hypothetical protein